MKEYKFEIDDKSDIKDPIILIHKPDKTTEALQFNKSGVARIPLDVGFHLVFWVARGTANQKLKVNVTVGGAQAIKPIEGKIGPNGTAKGVRILDVK